MNMIARRMPITALLSIIGIVLCAQVGRAEWVTIELQGHYDDREGRNCPWYNWRFGKGQVAYSFALKKILQANSDITMIASIPGTNQVLLGILYDQAFDIGALPDPPKSVSLPRSFNISENYKNGRALLVGHYYYMRRGDSHWIVQLVDFTPSPTVIVEKKEGFFGHTYYASDVSASFRIVFSGFSLEDLNRNLSGVAPLPKKKTDAVPATPPKSNRSANESNSPTDKRVKPSPMALTDSNALLAQYEQFQKDAKDFIDLPTEEATIARCDKLLETAKSLNTQINDVISDEDSTITGNNAKISSLQERLAKITDLQLKDRILTRITKIKAETEKLQKELKEWTARLDELQKTEKRLKEYRLIIGI